MLPRTDHQKAIDKMLWEKRVRAFNKRKITKVVWKYKMKIINFLKTREDPKKIKKIKTKQEWGKIRLPRTPEQLVERKAKLKARKKIVDARWYKNYVNIHQPFQNCKKHTQGKIKRILELDEKSTARRMKFGTKKYTLEWLTMRENNEKKRINKLNFTKQYKVSLKLDEMERKKKIKDEGIEISKEQENQVFLDIARNDLLAFCVLTDKNFTISKHHELIANALLRLMRGEIKNLIISMPPRAWKSRIMQEFIAYVFWKYGEKNDVIITGHSMWLLEDFSRHIRDRVNSDEFKMIFPNTKIKEWNSAINSWGIEGKGIFSIFWVGGGITGKWFDIWIIDDPYASREEAESDTIRHKVSQWFWSTFRMRKQNDRAKTVMIMQRWREDDLVWEIIAREWENWEVLVIPAIWEDWLSFWADKFSLEYFEDIKKDPYIWSSQYQQDPVNEWGGDFKKEYFEYIDRDKVKIENLDIITFVDPAISQRQSADETAIVTIWIDKWNFIYILDIIKWRFAPDEIIRQTFDTAIKYINQWQSYRCGVETVAYQKMLFLELEKEMRRRDFFFILEEVMPKWWAGAISKNARIKTVLQPRYANHTIIHITHTKNLWDLELQLLKFPNGKHDDIIDALYSAVSLVRTQSLATKWGYKILSTKSI